MFFIALNDICGFHIGIKEVFDTTEMTITTLHPLTGIARFQNMRHERITCSTEIIRIIFDD
jgi:hypothetical protein